MYRLQVVLTLLPLDEKTPEWAARMTRSSLSQCIEYNSLTLHIEDEKALRSGRPYVVGEVLGWAAETWSRGLACFLRC